MTWRELYGGRPRRCRCARRGRRSEGGELPSDNSINRCAGVESIRSESRTRAPGTDPGTAEKGARWTPGPASQRACSHQGHPDLRASASQIYRHFVRWGPATRGVELARQGRFRRRYRFIPSRNLTPDGWARCHQPGGSASRIFATHRSNTVRLDLPMNILAHLLSQNTYAAQRLP